MCRICLQLQLLRNNIQEYHSMCNMMLAFHVQILWLEIWQDMVYKLICSLDTSREAWSRWYVVCNNFGTQSKKALGLYTQISTTVTFSLSRLPVTYFQCLCMFILWTRLHVTLNTFQTYMCRQDGVELVSLPCLLEFDPLHGHWCS